MNFIPIPREGHEGEEDLVEVVLDIKVARETGAGEFVFVPTAVLFLMFDEVLDTTLGGRAFGSVGFDQAHHRPGGL